MPRTSEDRLTPSIEALKELDNPEYLGKCDVVGKTVLRDATITYEVEVGDWTVWYRVGEFGSDAAHRAAGAAFVGLAREQEATMHLWADKILIARGVAPLADDVVIASSTARGIAG